MLVSYLNSAQHSIWALTDYKPQLKVFHQILQMKNKSFANYSFSKTLEDKISLKKDNIFKNTTSCTLKPVVKDD